MDKRISIIVPVYKVEDCLNRCVQSIVDQTYENLEIILVDDGSPDQCPEMCDRWAQQDNRIRVIHKENGGPSSARNMALDIAQGEYLYFVDSDDYIDPSLCKRVMEHFVKNDVDIVIFDSYRISDSGKALGGTEKICDGILSREAALSALMQGNINHYAWNKMYKRCIFDGVRFPEGRLWEDVAISYKLMLNADRIYCCSKKLYYYCERGNSITATLDEKALGDIFLARYNCYKELKDIYPSVGDLAFYWVVLSARRLYDRSLWAAVDLTVLVEAQTFLAEHKGRVLKENRGVAYKLYYSFPRLYIFLRTGKHKVGTVVKRILKR